MLYTNPLSTDPTEKVSLQVVSQGPFNEGDNVTLKCMADGNPPPSSYIFYVKVDLLNLTQCVHFYFVPESQSGNEGCVSTQTATKFGLSLSVGREKDSGELQHIHLN